MNTLIVSQVYPPDPAAVGQHLHEVAAALVSRGGRVAVLTANRGYENPGEKFSARECRDGVEIRRLAASSLGKSSIFIRLIGQGSFLLQVLLRLLFAKKPDRLLISTSPPLMGIVAWLARRLRGIAVVYWLMDLNPDQAVELGVYRPGHPFVRLFDWMNRRILGAAQVTIVLDRFMEARVRRKIGEGSRVVVIPPWAPAGLADKQNPALLPREENDFRKEHGLQGKTVFMYSGNHSWVHPLGTILEASQRLSGRDDIVFVFVGGGKGKAEVDDFIQNNRPANVLSLPYQPLEKLPVSLAAGDVHIVAMGDQMVGCVHPCKIYGVLALGVPILALGPEESHIGEIAGRHGLGRCVRHGDPEAAARAILQLAELGQAERAEIRERSRKLMQKEFNREELLQRVVEQVEGGGEMLKR